MAEDSFNVKMAAMAQTSANDQKQILKNKFSDISHI